MSSAPQPKTTAELTALASKLAFSMVPQTPSRASTPSQAVPPSKVVPPHPMSPPAAPPAKRQKIGTPRAPATDPPSGSPKPSVFDVLNVFRRRWFLHRDHLIANLLSATKDEAGKLDWIDFQPPFHTHLVRKAVSLLPPLCPVAKGKRVMFVYLLEVLNVDSHGLPGRSPGPLAFFDSLKNPSPKSPKKDVAARNAPAPAPPVSYSGAPQPGLRVGGEPAAPHARGVKTKKTLQTPGLSREAREAVRR